MSALGTIAFVLPLLGSNVRTDLASGVQTTSRAGLIASDAASGGESQTDTAVDLLTGLRLISDRTTFFLVYRPRLIFQIPGTIELGRPLLLHGLNAAYDTELSRRTNFGLQLSADAGEISYSYLYDVLEQGTGTLTATTIPLLMTNGAATLDHRTSRRNNVAAMISAGYQTQPDFLFGDTDERPLPTSFNSLGSLTDIYTLSLKDRISFAATGGYISTRQTQDETVDTPGEVSVFGGNVSWRRSLSSRSELDVTLGSEFTYTHELDQISFIPTGVLGLSTTFGGNGQNWSMSTRGGAQGFLDQVSSTYRPQGFVSWDLLGAFGRRWTSGVSVFGSTALDPDPLTPPQFETNVSLEQPTNYQLSPNASLRFGTRYSVRGPHLLDGEGVTPQGEMIAFLGFRYTVGTDRNQGAWLR